MTEDPERRWLREVYRGEAPQLTARAVAAGMALGGALCLSNLYVTLKTGWSLGVTLTSCLLAFALFRILAAIGVARRPLSELENNAVGSVASAAAFMTGGGNMAALPALLLLTGARPGGVAMFVWFAAIAALGVLAAIPIKRRLINVEQLPFPSAVATAETLRSMHGERGDARRARILLVAAALAAIFTLLRDLRSRLVPFHVPGQIPIPLRLGGRSASSFSIAVDGSPVLLGGGALMGPRTAWSMLAGAVLAYGVLAPALVARGDIAVVSYKAIVQLTLWPGAGLLVASGLSSLVLDWRSIRRALASLRGAARRGAGATTVDPIAAVEAPAWWFPLGVVVLSPIVVFLMRRLFGIPVWMGILSIPLALLLSIVAARVTGETDITPTKALGPATQLLYGVALPGNVTANVMGANVTGGVGLHAADLLTDLKTGYLLGASPRKQVVAQMFGVIVGAAVVVPAFRLVVPSADALGTEQLPAPAVMVWAGVSRVLANGVGALAPAARAGLIAGLLAGVLLSAIERAVPRRLQGFVPSASGLGIAMVMPASSSISMFAGAVLTGIWRRSRPEAARLALIPIASGAIAGESLLGISLAIARSLGVAV